VLDRTGATAKVRFDGTNETLKLDRQPGAYGRIDYIRRVGLTVLQHWDNGRVKKSMAKVSGIVCSKGTGTIGYSLKGAAMTFTVDVKYDKNNPAGQRDDLVLKLKKDLDK
jgi:hypothetical protein